MQSDCQIHSHKVTFCTFNKLDSAEKGFALSHKPMISFFRSLLKALHLHHLLEIRNCRRLHQQSVMLEVKTKNNKNSWRRKIFNFRTHFAAFYPTTINVMTPPPHPTVPVDFTGNKPPYAPSTVTASPLVATENTFGQIQHVTPGPSPEIETRFLPQHIPTPTPPPPPRGPFIDPLETVPKSFEGKYFGHDPAENGILPVISHNLIQLHVIGNIFFSSARSLSAWLRFCDNRISRHCA